MLIKSSFIICLSVFVFCFCAAQIKSSSHLASFDNDSDIVAAGTKPKLISNQFLFTEGPTADKEGNVFFTDQPNNKIWKYGTDGKLTIFMDSVGRSNGLYIDKDGNMIACADEHNQLWLIQTNGTKKALVTNYKGHILNGPNDVWKSPAGNTYFTDPYFQRDYWTRTKPDSLLGGERLYLLPKNKKQIQIADSSLVKPNGVVGTPDGKRLYVADIGGWKLYSFTINKNGTLSNRQLFANEGGDGITLDNRGNVYVAGKGVTVYNSRGQKIKHIDVPEKWTANVCFGGVNRNILFITASTAIYTLETLVTGAE